MGIGLELVGFSLSDAAATGAQAMAALNGQSATIRATAGGSAAVTLESIATDFQDAGDFRIRSPRMHDDVNGIRVAAPAGIPQWAANEYFAQPLYSQDALITEAVFTVAPTAGHTSLAYLNVYYDDVPGIAANLRTPAEVLPNVQNILAVPVTPTSSATLGNWGAGVALNSTVDTLKANTLYALLGYVTPVAFGAWSIQGVDVGNLQLGAIGSATPWETRNWFARLSDEIGKPCIPIINSQNKASTLINVSDKANATAFEITLILAQLSA
jgi:hypothetical protein